MAFLPKLIAIAVIIANMFNTIWSTDVLKIINLPAQSMWFHTIFSLVTQILLLIIVFSYVMTTTMLLPRNA